MFRDKLKKGREHKITRNSKKPAKEKSLGIRVKVKGIEDYKEKCRQERQVYDTVQYSYQKLVFPL